MLAFPEMGYLHNELFILYRSQVFKKPQTSRPALQEGR